MTILKINDNFGINLDEPHESFGAAIYRVVALRDIHMSDGSIVEKGACGGLLSREAIVGDSVRWFGARCRIFGGKFWDGEFRGGEFWGGKFWDGEFWDGEFWDGEFRGGEFWGGKFWGGEFRGGDVVTHGPIYITGLRWNVTITDIHMTIGCQRHSIEKWRDFDEEKIEAMDDDALEFSRDYREMLLNLCAKTGRLAP